VVHLPLQFKVELHKKSEFQLMRKEVFLQIYLLPKCDEKPKYCTFLKK